MTTFLEILTKLPVRPDGSAEPGWETRELTQRLKTSLLQLWGLETPT
jgi:hypothetical protein